MHLIADVGRSLPVKVAEKKGEDILLVVCLGRAVADATTSLHVS